MGYFGPRSALSRFSLLVIWPPILAAHYLPSRRQNNKRCLRSLCPRNSSTSPRFSPIWPITEAVSSRIQSGISLRVRPAPICPVPTRTMSPDTDHVPSDGRRSVVYLSRLSRCSSTWRGLSHARCCWNGVGRCFSYPLATGLEARSSLIGVRFHCVSTPRSRPYRKQ